MTTKFSSLFISIGILLLVAGYADTAKQELASNQDMTAQKVMPVRDLASFKQDSEKQACYDRKTEPYTFVVDGHMHPLPFAGEAVPFAEMNEYFKNAGVRFAIYFGIGQILEVSSTCTYYLDCPGIKALPSIKNDFINAYQHDIFYDKFPEKEVDIVLSMTFPDLAHPENAADTVHLYDKEYPGMFKWAGELNLIKQALLPNGHEPATIESIDKMADFMKILRERHIPVTMHSDLGNNEEPTKYLYLMEHLLKRYPDNIIIWAHMGLSKELSKMDPALHVKIMKTALDTFPNLILDTSWQVLWDEYHQFGDVYFPFINEYSNRILPGTDFVASRAKNFEIYKSELEVNSRYLRGVSDEAFRNIALGENYFRLMNMPYHAPEICH